MRQKPRLINSIDLVGLIVRLNLVAFILLIFSCSNHASVSATSIGQEADLSMYVEKLNFDLEKIGHPPVNVSGVKFYSWKYATPEANGIGGRCSVGSDGFMKISVVNSTTYFSWFTYYAFVHEIGHCVYNKGHFDSAPSIMNTTQSPFTYQEFKGEAYRLELLRQMLTQ